MKTELSFPADSVGHCDFVTKRTKLSPGEKVINLQVDVETLPAFGQLCIHENTVKMMAKLLGWELATDLDAKAADELTEAMNTISQLENQLANIRAAIDHKVPA